MNASVPRLVRLVPIAAVASLVVALVRVTHANAPVGRYTVPTPANGTVYDTRTKLTWQQPIPLATYYQWGSPSTPGTGQNYCATLALGGLPAGAWRLPTVSELQTLVDHSQWGGVADGGPGALIDSAYFPGTPGYVFWSSTPLVGFPDWAWGVNFNFGNSNGYDVLASYYVRCVH